MLEGEWVVGFTEADGSFGLSYTKGLIRPVFRIGQDEQYILEKIKEYFGFGGVYGPYNGMYDYQVFKIDDLRKLVAFFDGRLHSLHKAEDFESWKYIVTNHPAIPREYWTEEEDQMVIDLVKKGYTNRMITEVLDRTMTAIGHRRHRVLNQKMEDME